MRRADVRPSGSVLLSVPSIDSRQAAGLAVDRYLRASAQPAFYIAIRGTRIDTDLKWQYVICSFNTRSPEIVEVCLEMFNCLQAELTTAIRKRKFLNKFIVINNA